MNIEYKKTALDDDSILYQKRGDSVSQKNLKALSSKEKFQYFKDYYLLKIIVVLAIVIGIGHMCYTMIFNRMETVLGIGVLGGAYIPEAAAMEEKLQDILQIEDKHQFVSVGNYDLNESAQTMAFAARLSNHDLDIILCDEENFERQCEFDHFYPLDEVLTPELLSRFEDRLIMGEVAIQDELGNIIDHKEKKAYGIDVSNAPFYKEFGAYSETAIIAFPVSTERIDRIYEFLNSPELMN